MADMSDFLKLREMGSLLSLASAASLIIEDEVNRLKRRESAKSDREDELNKLDQESRELSHQLAALDRQLLQRLDNAAKTRLEEEGLVLMVRQQEVENAQEDARTFLAGYEFTLTDLRTEIESAITVAKNKRDSALARAAELRENLPTDWRAKYDKIAARNLAHGPFTKLQNTQCYFCRHQVSRVFESDVDVKMALLACPGCGRLVLPYQVASGQINS